MSGVESAQTALSGAGGPEVGPQVGAEVVLCFGGTAPFFWVGSLQRGLKGKQDPQEGFEDKTASEPHSMANWRGLLVALHYVGNQPQNPVLHLLHLSNFPVNCSDAWMAKARSQVDHPAGRCPDIWGNSFSDLRKPNAVA